MKREAGAYTGEQKKIGNTAMVHFPAKADGTIESKISKLAGIMLMRNSFPVQGVPWLAKILVLAIFSGFSALSPAGAQLISISAQFDTTSIWIGEQVMFTITVEQPGDMHVEFPQLQDTLSQRIEIIAEHPSDTVSMDGEKLRITKSYTVTSFYQGDHFAEALPFAFLIDDDERVLYTRPARLVVMAPEVDREEGIFDIKAPFGIPVGFLEVLPWLLAAVAITFIIWYLARFYRKQKEKPAEPDVAEPSQPPHTIALRDLKELRKKSLWQKGKVKEHYTRMTEIVRIYIERRFGIMAMEMTSDEILRELSETRQVDNEVIRLLADCLAIADLVKFAKARPGEKEHETSLDAAFHFVKATCSNSAGSNAVLVAGQAAASEENTCKE